MKKKFILLSLFISYCMIFMGCEKLTLFNKSTNDVSDVKWKCIYMGAMVMDAAPQMEEQITFDNEDEWLEFANDNLPGSIVDVVDQEINWESEGVIVLQGLSANGYFSSMPPITNVDIKNGILNVEYDDNVDTRKSFYVRSDDYSDTIKTIYMILLDKPVIEKIN